MTAPLLAMIIVATAWLVQACGRTPLSSLDVGQPMDSRTGTSTRLGDATTPSQPSPDAACPTGLTACGRRAAIRCVDLTVSPEHCGQCGLACAPGITCQAAKCQQYTCKGALSFKTLRAVAVATSGTSLPETMDYYQPVLGDFDGDGDLDFVGQLEVLSPMGLLLGQGDGTFQPRSIASTFSRAWSAAAADVNGDGRLDLATIATAEHIPINEPAVTLRLNDGDPATLFAVGETYPTSSSPGDLVLADLDDDGRTDLVTVEKGHLTLWRGTSAGRLGEPTEIPVGVTAPDFTAATYFLRAVDWNGDRALDLLYGVSTLRMLQGRGDGTFAPEIACGLALAADRAATALADFDHDGRVDMVLGSKVLLGMNGCNFSTSRSLPKVGVPLVVADLDGDGNQDIVTNADDASPNHSEQISVHLGDGHGGFASPVRPAVAEGLPGGYSGGAFLVGDLNHDTKLDIISTYPNGWRVRLNTCP